MTTNETDNVSAVYRSKNVNRYHNIDEIPYVCTEIEKNEIQKLHTHFRPVSVHLGTETLSNIYNMINDQIMCTKNGSRHVLLFSDWLNKFLSVDIRRDYEIEDIPTEYRSLIVDSAETWEIDGLQYFCTINEKHKIKNIHKNYNLFSCTHVENMEMIYNLIERVFDAQCGSRHTMQFSAWCMKIQELKND